MEADTPTETTAKDLPSTRNILNVPNQLSIARLVLSIVFFAFLAVDWYLTSLVLFVIAAGTDWIDGYWARRYGQITQLGRVLDPFADKIIICGAFIFLAAVPRPIGNDWLPASAIAPWMAVVVVAREMLVTALRSFFEEGGVDFSAKWAGKWKMVFQCLAVGLSLYRLSYFDPRYSTPMWREVPPDWLTYSLHVTVWLAIVMTIYSGWGYVQAALRMLKK